MTENFSKALLRWHNANESLKRLKSEINGAECEVKNATNALGKLLCPNGATEDESFNVWVNREIIGLPSEGLLVATVKRNNDYSVEWYKGKKE